VFWVDVIFWVDDTISVGIIISNFIDSDCFNIFTRPSSWAFLIYNWTFTESITETWAVGSSVFIFSHDEASVDFTTINLTV
jgi:hypothetical protein